MNYFISLAGNIGVGKTNFTKTLSKRLGWQVYLEPVEENPYLEDFYQDMKSWAFHSQTYYLSKRIKDHFELAKRSFSVIQDRSFYENVEIFAKNLYQQGNMTERDWKTLQEMYTSILQISTPPDLVIYLKGKTSTLAERILQRGRESEKPITLDYIDQLNNLYNQWIENFTLCPTLTIPIEGTDLRDREAEQDLIIEKVWEILQNKSLGNQKHFIDFNHASQNNLNLPS